MEGSLAELVMYARTAASLNNLKGALEMYLVAFDAKPMIKKELEDEFRELLSRLNAQVAASADKTDILHNFQQAIAMFPDNINILNDIGNYLFGHGYFFEALCHFEKALKTDNSLAGIEKIRNKTKNLLLPRQHFRVLNDITRNRAYGEAIRRTVTVSDTVLELNAGVGLLALYANVHNPAMITTCESSPTIARLAECVMEENNAQEVVIVNKHSLMLDSNDIYGKMSVLLADILDSSLLGKYILLALSHAWERLLYDGSKVIPGRAEYFIAAVKCDALHNKYRLCQDIKDTLNVTHIDVRTTTYCNNTYYGDDVHSYKDLKYMCEPQSLFTIDFNNYDDIQDKLYNPEPYVAELVATEDGEMNVVIGWFNLHLTDDIVLTSDPRSVHRASAYQQAVFFDVPTMKVKRNETINIPFTTFSGQLRTINETDMAITRISPETIAYLNDSEYMSMIKNSISSICAHLEQSVDITEVDIVDLSPFPVLGILMMRRGANSLICYAKTDNDKAFLNTVLLANGISDSKVNILPGVYWSDEAFVGKKFHLIFNQVIEYNGDVDVTRISIAEHLKHNHLAFGGLCLPATVTMYAQLVYSHYLEVNNRVNDAHLGYSVAKHVNRYQVSQALHLDYHQLQYTPLSNEFEVTNCDVITSDIIKVPILRDGDCNAIVCWYKVQLMEQWNAIYTNRSNCFVQCMAYMASPSAVKVHKNDVAHVLKCVDKDGPYKLILDVDS